MNQPSVPGLHISNVNLARWPDGHRPTPHDWSPRHPHGIVVEIRVDSNRTMRIRFDLRGREISRVITGS